MSSSEIIETLIEKVNDIFNKLENNNSVDKIIGNIDIGDITMENCYTFASNYLEAISESNKNGYLSLSLKYTKDISNLCKEAKHSLILIEKILTILANSEDLNLDKEISEEFVAHSINKDLLKDIQINNETIDSYFLHKNKILLVKNSPNFRTFISELEVKETNLLYIAKAILDNFDYIMEYGIEDYLLFLPYSPSGKIDNTELVSYLKLCILSEGESIHKHFVLYKKTNFDHEFRINTSENYSQYSDIMYIISEYNYSNDILHKYFLLYTIIENFMYRKPIAEMLRTVSKFSIRDFKRFYSNIGSKEFDVIKKLFKEIMEIRYPVQNNIKVCDDVCQFLNDFKNNHVSDLSSLENFLNRIEVTGLDLQSGKTQLKEQLKDGIIFAKIVYHLRNSILHNTATEYHITHIELAKEPIIADFLKDFMIPILEKIIFSMIYSSSEIIRYDQNTLTLYDK
ncbi:hypothetical protein [Campylobacter sputorum]|uniref:hypothetical protein n=1 Tax=Campylobacter sputorum TaxID=206 RepID=UPI00053C05C0|nr:hypothetical protein [Campylobacter sputorum]